MSSENSGQCVKKRKQTLDEPETAVDVPRIEALEAFNSLLDERPKARSLFADSVSEEERASVWQFITNEAANVCEKYSWAIPDNRALRILDYFSPVVEIGAGSGYWAHCMRSRNIECSAFDKYSTAAKDSVGTLESVGWSEVKLGGPEVLLEEEHQNKTLLLCYPDDFELRDNESEDPETPLALQCLQNLQSDTLIHCGELFGDTASMDHAPWGRTTSADAQTILFSRFRCVLKVPLPSWPHCNDFLTVWRRADTCFVSFSDPKAVGGNEEGSEEDSSDDNMEFVCNFRDFGLGAVQPKDGWALKVLQHLL